MLEMRDWFAGIDPAPCAPTLIPGATGATGATGYVSHCNRDNSSVAHRTVHRGNKGQQKCATGHAPGRVLPTVAHEERTEGNRNDGRNWRENKGLTLCVALVAPVAHENEVKLHAPAEWTRDDWLDFIDERVAILEFDGGHPRAEAEAHAYAEARAQWLRRHPTHVDPTCCAGCGQAIADDRSAVNVVRDGARVHAACWTAYLRRRHADAAAALARVGITPPRKENATHA